MFSVFCCRSQSVFCFLLNVLNMFSVEGTQCFLLKVLIMFSVERTQYVFC